MPEEIWKPISGYEGQYEVSNLGNVRSLDRYCLGRDGRSEIHHGRMLKKQKLWNGYLNVDLNNGKKRWHRPVHILVAEAFIGPRPENNDVMHIDGDRTNNRAENLCYGTRAENLHQMYEYGGKLKKLSREDVLDIMNRLNRGEDYKDLAKEYGVNNAAVCHIKNKTVYKWLWEEVEANAT